MWAYSSSTLPKIDPLNVVMPLVMKDQPRMQWSLSRRKDQSPCTLRCVVSGLKSSSGNKNLVQKWIPNAMMMAGTLSIGGIKGTKKLLQKIDEKRKKLWVRWSRKAMYCRSHYVLPSTSYGTSDSNLGTGSDRPRYKIRGCRTKDKTST